MVRLPKEFVEECSLFIRSRIDWYDWNKDDVDEFKMFVRGMWESGLRSEIVDYVTRETRQIHEMQKESVELFKRIKSRMKSED